MTRKYDYAIVYVDDSGNKESKTGIAIPVDAIDKDDVEVSMLAMAIELQPAGMHVYSIDYKPVV